MSAASRDLSTHARELCRIFLGWKLREDWDALMAIGEGALRIDLRSGEAWCDGEPLPPLFIAGELRGWLAGQGVPPESLEEAQLEALFAPRLRWSGGREVAGLQISCCVRLVDGDEVWRADARNG